MSSRTTPSFVGLVPASGKARAAARGASRKRDTSCELLLRQALRSLGLRSYRIACPDLAGQPDVVFRGARVVVFCDGDFWHGRDLEERLQKLAVGHNAPYWTAKIRRNVERDRANDARLAGAGWVVLRFWETDIRRDAEAVAKSVANAIAAARPSSRAPGVTR